MKTNSNSRSVELDNRVSTCLPYFSYDRDVDQFLYPSVVRFLNIMPPKKKKQRTDDPKVAVLSTGKCIHTKDSKAYFDYITIHPPHTSLQWTIFVGDIVAVACQQSKGRKDPFGVSWSPVQILSFYQTSKDKRYKMSIRWFYRYCELPNKKICPKSDDFQQQDQTVYETDQIQVYDVNKIMGKVILTSTSTGAGYDSPLSATQLPTILLRCTSYLRIDAKTHEQVNWENYNLFSGMPPSALSRGLRSESDSGLLTASSIAFCGDRLSFKKKPAVVKLESTTLECQKPSTVNKPQTRIASKKSETSILQGSALAAVEYPNRSTMKSISTGPRSPSSVSTSCTSGFVNMCPGEVIHENNEGIKFFYTIKTSRQIVHKIGDVVAVACNQDNTPKNMKWSPFSQPWSPAQLLAFFEDIDGTYKVILRWFYRIYDLCQEVKEQLPDTHPKMVFERDMTDTFPVSTILGPVIMTADADSNLLKAPPKGHAVLICNHTIYEDEVEANMNWNTYNPESLQCKPLLDGLNCLTDEILIGAIENAIRGTGDSSTTYMDNETDDGGQSERVSLTESIVSPKTIMAEVEPFALLHSAPCGDGMRKYYSSANIPIQARYCAPRVVKHSSRGEHWKLKIGDVVCMRTEDCMPQAYHILQKYKSLSSKPARKWYPFTVCWSYAQVLNIYKGEKSDEILLEIRWLLRFSETCLDPASIPFRTDTQIGVEEIFETHDVHQGVPIERVLGLAEVFLGHHNDTGRPKTMVDIPKVKARCRYLFTKSVNHFQTIFCGDRTPKDWFLFLNERGRDVSALCRMDSVLSYAQSFLVEPELSLFADMEPETSETAPCLLCTRGDQQFFSQVSLLPPWNNFSDSKFVCHPRYRKSILKWKVQVGDVLACHGNESQRQSNFDSGSHEWHPFVVPWSPCQVMAIYHEGGHLKFEVRWFYQAVELRNVPPTDVVVSERLRQNLIYEKEDSPTSFVGTCSLLGPLTLISIHSEGASVMLPPPFMPLHVQLFGGTYSEVRNAFNSLPWSPLESVHRGLQCTTAYGETELDRKEIFQLLESSLKLEDAPRLLPPKRDSRPTQDIPRKKSRLDNSRLSCEPCSTHGHVDTFPCKDPSQDENRVWIDVKPYYEDLSAKQSFYTEMHVKAPESNYALENQTLNSKEHWTVKMGDPVAVHWEFSARKSNFEADGPRNTFFPFKVPWAVGEVTSIWIDHESANDLPSQRKRPFSPFNQCREKIMVELRWFYREDELPGAIKAPSKGSRAFSITNSDEVFETDHVDDAPATSLLAPVFLNQKSTEETEYKLPNGIPIVKFECRRMWSIHRKSLVPIGCMLGRVERGRMNSQIFRKNKMLRRALDCHFSTTEVNACMPPLPIDCTWNEAFESVIKKLSLIEASEDAHERGVDLIGREPEQLAISSFLRNAISGSERESIDGSEVTSSILIAGPPGTGKTATVCSIIAKLRKEQADGHLPIFEFIALNGMEMRHPFEAYIKFWEAVSGTREKQSPEVAAAKLDQYFAGMQGRNFSTSNNTSTKPVIVLLLDEIDYLVTKKQTVIYNFFDWPKRALESNSGPRLVVIGISNTLNLPSRLKPSVQSRLGNSRCAFKAYTAQGMVEILAQKIQPDPMGYQVFEKDAILFCARKIASFSGDLRKALKTCQSAAEGVMKEVKNGVRHDPRSAKDRPMVRIKDVQKASRESFSSVAVNAIAASTPLEALLLVSLGSLCKSTGRHAGGFDIKELMTKMDAAASASGDDQYLPPPSVSATLSILSNLGEACLVRLETPKSSIVSFRAAQGGSGGAFPLVSIEFDYSVLIRALKDTPHHDLAEKHLGEY